VIIHDCEQGTTRWLKLRAGIPTASEFSRIITPTGKASGQWDDYMYTLLAERLTGKLATPYVSLQMERGSRMEAEAVAYYDYLHGVITERVGFITTDDGRYGASPDRLVGEEGLLEIKVPSPHTHVGYLLGKGADKTYKPQIQGQLLVTGRAWVDIMSYNPGLPQALVRVHRDDGFIRDLAKHLDDFCRVMAGYYEQLKPLMPALEPAPELFITVEDIEQALEWHRKKEFTQ
jgi:hypothetical protein